MPRCHQSLVLSNERSSIFADSGKNPGYIVRNSASSAASTVAWVRKPEFSPRTNAIEEEDRAIEAEIQAASFILEIGNELDDPDFVPYCKETLDRVVSFLRRLAIHAHSCGFSGFGAPEILPADRGSIELLWRSQGKKLLMSFPADAEEKVSFYGKKGTSELSGRFESWDRRSELIYWLVE
jgi:hypothetical protein